MREEIKRCNCGGNPVFRVERGATRRGRPVAGCERLVCADCGKRTTAMASRQALRAEWNEERAEGESAPAAFVRFGVEWQQMVMRQRKSVIVASYKRAALEAESLRKTVQRLQAQMNRSELQTVIANLVRRGTLTTGKAVGK